jgi:hypothetical protein
MKYLISVSVALAIAMPAWAQTTPPPAQTPMGHHVTTRHHVFRSRSDNSADNLNAQELTTLQGGGPFVQRMPSGGKQLTDPNR